MFRLELCSSLILPGLDKLEGVLLYALKISIDKNSQVPADVAVMPAFPTVARYFLIAIGKGKGKTKPARITEEPLRGL